MNKRLICLGLCLILTLSCAACGSKSDPVDAAPAVSQEETLPVAPEDTADLLEQELSYARELGIPMEKNDNETITGQELAQLLDWFVAYAAPGKLENWLTLYPIARLGKMPVSRIDAMAYFFLAAEYVGGGYLNYDPIAFEKAAETSPNWMTVPLGWGMFGSTGYYYTPSFGSVQLDQAGFCFAFSCVSPISGEYLFSVDKSFSTAPTYGECVLAIARLIAAAEYDPALPESAEPYLAQMDQRREEIRNAQADCTEGVTGKIYYISNQGDDRNDGLSPETPWATVAKMKKTHLKSGDAVLFERGGTWYVDPPTNGRLGQQQVADLTIGAYGEGDKPIIRGDIPQANDADFWELHWEENGVRIWKTKENLYDAPVIVFNEGESWAQRIQPWWDGEKSYINPDGTSFVLEQTLSEDLTYTRNPELTAQYIAVLRGTEDVAYQGKAPIYLRCDAGNPAEVFSTVSLVQAPSFSNNVVLAGRVVDLDLRYFGMCALAAASADFPCSYQNVEISWSGGLLKNYGEAQITDDLVGYKPFASGGGIQATNHLGVTIDSCYFYQVAPKTLVVAIPSIYEDPDASHIRNFHVTGSLFEYCGPTIEWYDLTASYGLDDLAYMSDILFEDNIIANSGYGCTHWNIDNDDDMQTKADFWGSSISNVYGAAMNENFCFRNNLFFRSVNPLISLRETLWDGVTEVNAHPTFTGNTYVQDGNKPLLRTRLAGGWEEPDKFYAPSQAAMTDLLGDTTGTLVVLS